jgi:hypothetical protein
MTTEADALKKPEDQAKPVEQQAAGADPVQTEDEKIWAEAIATDEPELAAAKATGEEVSHEMAGTSEAVTESKDDAGKDASEGADKPADVAAKSTDTPAASTPKEDIWANASPELRAAHEAEVAAALKTANDAKRHAGRMRKQYEELQKASAGREADKPGSKKVGDLLKESLAEYPEIRDPVTTALAPIEKQLEGLAQRAASDTAAKHDEVEDHVRREERILEGKHPNWQDEYCADPRKSDKAKAFYAWVDDQPRAIREVITVTNRQKIFDAEAAIRVFDAYKAHLSPPETSAPVKDDGQTQELSAKRAAQLDGTVSPRSPGGAPRVSGIPKEGDPDAMWKAIPDDNADDKLKGGGFLRRRA